MGLLRSTMPPKIQLLAVLAFGVAMLLIENQIQRLDESRAKLGKISSDMRETIESAVTSEPMFPSATRLTSKYLNSSFLLTHKSSHVRFVRNVTSWRERKPGFYHGHVAYLDFSKYGVKGKPLYINVVRDPIERLVSYYYFLRFGDDYRPGLRRRKQGDKKSFDECVSSGGSDCAPEKLWLQIPFFCCSFSSDSHQDEGLECERKSKRCQIPGLLVLYRGKVIPSHLRKTTEKKPPTKETITKLQQSAIWKMENEFYEFALEQFQFVRAHAVREKDGELYVLAQSFFYEKIYPKAN
uniref:Heparan sulfate 2-O-sulfotransferase 1b n=1 Tax=Cyprinodon variegatus TaxID=28743 RepID=A0A3Q2D8Y9_CYPVA